MSEFDEYQRRRWTRENAHLYIRHDAHRYMSPGAPFYVGQDVVKYGWPHAADEPQPSIHDAELLQRPDVKADLEFEAELRRLRCDIASMRLDWERAKLALRARKYNPDQPRVPAGNSDGGQWTSEGAQGSRLRVAGPGVGRGPTGNARFPNATPAQQARLVAADARAQDALRRVREVDPNWRAQPGAYGTGIESEILKANELSLIECPAFAFTVLRALWMGHETGINGFASLTGLLMAYFGARFGVLGVYVSGRSREKQACATGQLVPSALEGLLGALVKKK